jgi:hypothetical protein
MLNKMSCSTKRKLQCTEPCAWVTGKGCRKTGSSAAKPKQTQKSSKPKQPQKSSTVAELKAVAKARGIPQAYKMNKAQLITALKVTTGPSSMLVLNADSGTKCVFKGIQGAGYTPVKKLTAGFGGGSVYAACKPKDCDYILKIWPTMHLRANDDEIGWTKIAGELGIGPKVYASGKCPGVQYVLMQKLTGGMLSEKPFSQWTPKLLATVFSKYLKIIREAGIHQMDLKADNIMFSGSGEPFIIDYGNGFKGTKNVNSAAKTLTFAVESNINNSTVYTEYNAVSGFTQDFTDMSIMKLIRSYHDAMKIVYANNPDFKAAVTVPIPRYKSLKEPAQKLWLALMGSMANACKTCKWGIFIYLDLGRGPSEQNLETCKAPFCQ